MRGIPKQENIMQAEREKPGYVIALDIWRRRKWLAPPVAAGVITAAVSIAMFIPGVYQSSATLLVERQQVPEAFVQSTVTTGIDRGLQSITQQILSRSRLEHLIDHFDLYADVREQVPLERLIRRMREDIQIQQEGQEQLPGQDRVVIAFKVSYRGSDPQVVAQVTNTLASYYVEENTKVREQQASGTAGFLRVQLEAARQKLEKLEQQLSQAKERYTGELSEQLQLNLSTLANLSALFRQNKERQARSNERRTTLVQQLATMEQQIPGGGSGGAPLEQLQLQLIEARTRFREKHPHIVKLKEQIAALEQAPAGAEHAESQEPSTAETSPIQPHILRMQGELRTLEAEVKNLQIEERSLLNSILLYQQRIENTPQREQELQVLVRDYTNAKEHYQSLLKRQQEANLSESLEQSQTGEQFQLLDLAVPATQPSEPNRRRIMVIGLLASLGLAAGVMFLRDQLDTSFHTVEDLRAFSPLPVLVSLPRIVTKADTRRRRWRFVWATVATVLSLALIVSASYLVLQKKAELVGLLAKRGTYGSVEGVGQ
jgi:polysaccharide chain length determinant protein (PEP-CTERM system associated)